MKAYGIKESTVLNNDIDKHVEEIKIFGFTVVPKLISSDILCSTREKMDFLYFQQMTEMGGEDKLKQINDTYQARCLLAQDDFFLQFITHTHILTLITAFLGDYYILLLQNGILIPAKTAVSQGAWHRDLVYQHFTSSRPLALNVLWCIDEFNQTTGGTWVLPASHKMEAFPSKEYVLSHQESVEANAGDAIVFDSMLFHRAGNNQSSTIRRGLNHMYALPFFKQQISIPKALKTRHQEDPLLNKILGYDSEPPEDVLAWRHNRFKKLTPKL